MPLGEEAQVRAAVVLPETDERDAPTACMRDRRFYGGGPARLVEVIAQWDEAHAGALLRRQAGADRVDPLFGREWVLGEPGRPRGADHDQRAWRQEQRALEQRQMPSVKWLKSANQNRYVEIIRLIHGSPSLRRVLEDLLQVS